MAGLPPPRQIRFVNNQGHPPSKRRRINAAYAFFGFIFCPSLLQPCYVSIYVSYRAEVSLFCGTMNRLQSADLPGFSILALS